MPEPTPEPPAPLAAFAWTDGPVARLPHVSYAPHGLALPPDLLWDGRPLPPPAACRPKPWETITFRHRGRRRSGTVVEVRHERVRVVVDGAVLRIPLENVLS